MTSPISSPSSSSNDPSTSNTPIEGASAPAPTPASPTPKATPELTYPPVPGFPPHHFSAGGVPPPFAAPFYGYAPPDGSAQGDGNTPNGGTAHPGAFMMPYPPGMVYAFPPPGQAFGGGYPPPPALNALTRPKRRQVKMACTNCAAACKRCDEQRPCERCMKYGITETCIDGQRKERKKGIKRGPYKRKIKSAESAQPVEDSATPFPNQESESEWLQSPTTSNATTSAAIHAVATAHQFPIPPSPTVTSHQQQHPHPHHQQIPPPPEGYYHPYYYPPLPGLPLPSGVANGENGANGHPHPQAMPYYIHHPGFTPYPPFMVQGMVPPPPAAGSQNRDGGQKMGEVSAADQKIKEEGADEGRLDGDDNGDGNDRDGRKTKSPAVPATSSIDPSSLTFTSPSTSENQKKRSLKGGSGAGEGKGKKARVGRPPKGKGVSAVAVAIVGEGTTAVGRS